MAPGFLDNALGSKQASSLDPLAIALKRQKERRQLVGRQTGSVYTKEVLAASEKLQERNRIDYTGGSSPPKLQGTVPKLPPPKSPLAVLEGGKVPWSAEKTKSPDPLDSEEEDDDDDMTGGVTTRNMAKSVDNGKKVQLKKSDWDKVVAKEKENKATITQLNQANTNLKKDLEKSETLVAQLRLQIATLQKNRGGGKGRKSNCRKDEQKDDVKEAIKGYVKDVLFRTVKFAQPGSELKAATLSVWNGIKDNLKLDEGAHPLTPADFREIYESEVAAQLSGRRQYCQSRIQEACAEFWEDYGFLPTVEEMENVWDLPEVPDEEDTVAIEQYRRAVNILTWYLDKYMVQVAGLEFWGPNIRPYRLMTDKVEVDGDVSGKKKVLVTVTSEAFGLLLFANCREKWIITFQFKEKNGKKAPIPKYNKDDHDGTKQWLAKWSNSRSGSVSGGGWSKEAYKYFEAKKVALTEWRKTEAAGGYVNYQMGQTLVKAANGIAQETDKPASKRRKTDTAKPQDEIEVVDITFLDE